jgi:hypothetical protein
VSATDVSAVVTIIKGSLTAIAAVAATGVAIAGLKAWKRQLHGNAKYDLARRLLRATYKLREAINFVREPLIPAGEMAKALEDAGLKDALLQGARNGYRDLCTRRGGRPLRRCESNLMPNCWKAEALWGPEMQGLGLAVKQCLGELGAALQRYLSHRMPDDPERYMAIHYIVFGSEDDQFTKELQGAIAAIENYLKPDLKL